MLHMLEPCFDMVNGDRALGEKGKRGLLYGWSRGHERKEKRRRRKEKESEK